MKLMILVILIWVLGIGLYFLNVQHEIEHQCIERGYYNSLYDLGIENVICSKTLENGTYVQEYFVKRWYDGKFV